MVGPHVAERMSSAPDPPEPEAPARALRRPRADPGRGAAARGRGSPDPEAQHRQPRAVRLRGPRGDPRRHGPHLPEAQGYSDSRGISPPAPRSRSTTRRGGCGTSRRRRLHRQRRLRADLDGAAGVPGRRQRGPGPGAGLPAVDRRGLPLRRHPGALPLRRDPRLAPRPRRHRGQDHRPHPGPGGHQPQQPHGCGLQRGDRARAGRHRPAARPGGLRRRDLREDPLRRRRAPPRGDLRRRRCAVPDLQRALQGLPRVRLPGGLGDHLRPQAARRRLPRGPHPAREHADVRQRAGPARDPDGARRLPDHRGADRPRRPLLRADHARRPDAQRDPRCHLGAAGRGALLLPAAGPRRVRRSTTTSRS